MDVESKAREDWKHAKGDTNMEGSNFGLRVGAERHVVQTSVCTGWAVVQEGRVPALSSLVLSWPGSTQGHARLS